MSTNPLDKFVAQAPPIDSVRDGAARCCEETARWQRGERTRVLNPLDDGILGEFSDAEFGVAAEVATEVARAFRTAGVGFKSDQPWDFAARLLRAGWQRGHRLLPHVIAAKGARS